MTPDILCAIAWLTDCAVKLLADLTMDSPHSPCSATWANTPRRTDGPKLLSMDTTAMTRGMC